MEQECYVVHKNKGDIKIYYELRGIEITCHIIIEGGKHILRFNSKFL